LVALRRFHSPLFTNPFYSRVIEGMELEVTARGYNLLLSILPYDEQGSVAFQLPKLVREKNADGLVLLGEMPPALLKEVFERRIPGVVVDFFSPNLPAHYVLSDNRGGIRSLVKHLADLGHRSFAFVQSGVLDWSFSERQAAFEDACKEAGLEAQVWGVPSGTWPEIDAEIRRRLEGSRRPTAVLAANDIHALAVLRVAASLGLAVPKQLSVAGFDDIDAAADSAPGLTTLRVDKQAMGLHAIRYVFRLMEPPLEPEGRHDLPVELVVRGSTGPAPL
jgi:LacI family transcriptional regulator